MNYVRHEMEKKQKTNILKRKGVTALQISFSFLLLQARFVALWSLHQEWKLDQIPIALHIPLLTPPSPSLQSVTEPSSRIK